MGKIIAAINMTLDGFCDHTAGIADDELHEHYSELISNAGALLYGRVTYQLMQYWQTIVKDPTGNKALDDFAGTIDKIPKVVFSHTIKSLDWETARLATKDIKEEVLELQQKESKDILIGSPGLIAAMTELDLIEEYQLCIHPVILGNGLTLFKNITGKKLLTLLKTKTFGSGAIVLYYEAAGKR
ncbi:dihydrofolate reductase family protein [Ferruginibacter albus]|uniref:dihydrofolate reductase family protein n=1 Tax=Ferruginibacter albus TaxID=2875540 RepID=UPI001CC7609A|nr:dihydrofolate reductase family protein [Ferruginibacter albus]UAY53372.1 dihydrofolate reductase family protein [Ferruginibacter albus]